MTAPQVSIYCMTLQYIYTYMDPHFFKLHHIKMSLRFITLHDITFHPRQSSSQEQTECEDGSHKLFWP